ncbi:MAG: hypothetical protein K2X06_15050 [Burkholderiales bacterium]|nr:hypothetical protein [Burkholderiales bacterium]
MHRLDTRVAGLAAGFFLMISYVICVAGDLLFEHRMYEAWLKLLPGFTWLTWPSFLLGLIETFAYGIYFGLVFVPLYNFLQNRLSAQQSQ